MTYKVQQIAISITLNDDKAIEDGGLYFKVKDGNNNRYELTKTKTFYNPMCDIIYRNLGNVNSNKAEVTIFGLSPRTLQLITRYGMFNVNNRYNGIEIKANGVLIYKGDIVKALPDFNQAPNIPVVLSCLPSANLNLSINAPFSYDGDISLFNIINVIASPQGYRVENYDKERVINSPYLKGSAYKQIMEAVNMVDGWINIEDDAITLLNPDQGIGEDSITLSGETGLIGFPMYQDHGVIARTHFKPDYELNRKIKLETIEPYLNGNYFIRKIAHNISAQIPNGQFYSELYLVKDESIN